MFVANGLLTLSTEMKCICSLSLNDCLVIKIEAIDKDHMKKVFWKCSINKLELAVVFPAV